MEFRIFSIWYNVKIYTVITQTLIWEHINCIFGKGLSEASLKCSQNFFKNSLRENISIYDQEVQATVNIYLKGQNNQHHSK